MRSLAMLVAVLAALLLGASPAPAHVRDSTGYSLVTQQGKTVDYILEVAFTPLAKAIGMGEEALTTTQTPVRERLLREHSAEILAYLDERVEVRADGVRCQPRLDRTRTLHRDRRPFAELDLTYTCQSASPQSWTIDYRVFGADEGVIDGHTTIVDHTLGPSGAVERVVLDRAHPTLTTGRTSALARTWQMLQFGARYLLSGWDHVLLVVALVVGARTWRALAENVVVFTVAHSAGLWLAALGMVALPTNIAEPLVALSVAFVALDGLLNTSRHRLWSIGAFGLLHGIVLARALRSTQDPTWSFAGSLLGLNLGIEVGQLLVLALAVPLVLAVRRLGPRLATPATAATASAMAAVGLFWFAQSLVLGPA